MVRSRRGALALLFLAAGCGGRVVITDDDAGAPADLAMTPVDLVGADLAGADLRTLPPPDFASNTDLAGLGGPANAFTQKLGGAHTGHFLVGLGNDGTDNGDDPAYGFGVTLDLHYHYLVGLSTEGGWTTWNSNPDYAGKRINEAKAHGVIPMITHYAMAAHGDGNVSGSVGDAAYMKVWFKDFLQLLATIKAAGTPVVLHLEPDFWGYTEQMSIDNGGVTKVVARVSAAATVGATECQGQPDDIAGFGHCLMLLVRGRAPNALVGFHASMWGSKFDVAGNTDTSLNIAAEAQKTINFWKAIGADQADFVATDVSDRDSGCYEVGLVSPLDGHTVCNVRPSVYWDESNQKLPHYKQALAWATAITAGLKLPLIWWQIPMGVPSSSSGGTVGHWRDNRVHYFFSHTAELVAAGGVGAVYGTGDYGQTDFSSDGDQYKNAVTTYFASPFLLQ